ncbi:hypothetical protein KFE25_010282 [Diacronema lutheri]|uniref:Uncharacterized protein n=1 Tax=Diacronema lutheri TaxID=2081491 RepID=A0A8J6C5A7_DIALT|nr:hypothetical protein KFE25_010282 [Diacronema lutheri]
MRFAALIALVCAALARSHVPRSRPARAVARLGACARIVALSDVPAAADAPLPSEGAPRSAPSAEPGSYEEAERLGLALFAAGDYTGALKRFEQSKKLPGAGYDVVRISPGSQTFAPNPRGLEEKRFATPAQLAIAEYNIACAKLKLGARDEAIERLRAFVTAVDNPERQFERILSDPDLAELGAEMRTLQAELTAARRFNPLGGLKRLLDVSFVEWK